MNTAFRDLQTLFEVGSLGGLSDGQLLDRFVDRREEAVFEAIIHRHGSMVWGVCRRVLRDHHDAEDAFQATFLVLARKASSVLPREKLENWLYGVAYQTSRKARAMRSRRREREGQVSDMPEPMAVQDDRRDDLAECLDRELSSLPEKYRILIILCDLEGRTHGEAASQLGVPVGTVSSRLSRGRARLARRLSRPGMTFSDGSLAVLLAQEAASVSMPIRLIGPTARTASLFAAGGAATAGVVPAKVVALTREVMKMMLLSKIKVVTAMLVVVSALATGGTGLVYRVQASEPGSRKDVLQGPNDRVMALPVQEAKPRTDDGASRLVIKELVGKWKTVHWEVSGDVKEDDESPAALLMVEPNGQAVFSHQGEEVKVLLTIDPSTSPKQINLVYLHGTNKPDLQVGIYKLEDTGLTLCLRNETGAAVQERPRGFTTEGTRNVLVKLERYK